jgi:protein TonB
MPVIKKFKANLRAKYSRYIKLSIIFTLAMIIVAFKFSPPNVIPEPLPIDSTIWITVEDIENTIQKPKPPPPPIPEPLLVSLNENLEDIIFEDSEPDFDAFIGPPPPIDTYDDEVEPQIFVWSEIMPEPVGGIAAILQKVYYTEIAKRAEIEGKVVIEAVVDKQGNIIDAFVKIGIGGGLDEVALDAVKNTKFHPGMQRGKPVNVRISIPIKFVLR